MGSARHCEAISGIPRCRASDARQSATAEEDQDDHKQHDSPERVESIERMTVKASASVGRARTQRSTPVEVRRRKLQHYRVLRAD